MNEQARDGRRSLGAMAVAVAIAVGAMTVGVAMDVTGAPDVVIADAREHAREDGVGLCVNVAGGLTEADAIALEAAVLAEAQARPHLFPEVTVARAESPTDGIDPMLAIAAWPFVTSGQLGDDLAAPSDRDPCHQPSPAWTAAVTIDLLADGADAILANEQLSEGWSGSVAVTVEPNRSLVRSELTFSGPFGIGGHCWIDETITVDPATSTLSVTSESGNDAGLAGLVACKRFEESMVEGGAGGQAIALLSFAQPDRPVGDQRFEVESAEVTESAVVVSGRLAA